MKIKYKKVIIIATLISMFAGFITFSMIPSNAPEETMTESTIIEKSSIPEINELVNNYFAAKQCADMDSMLELLTDSTAVDEKKLQLYQTYVETYTNITTYLISNEDKDAFRVYVKYDIKLYNIDTLAPCMTVFYITQGSSGDYKIYNSPQDETIREFIESADKNMEVIKLKNDVQKSYEAARAKDARLNEFSKKLESETATAATGSAVQ